MPEGTITTGGTAQALVSSNGSRRGLSLQNNSTGDLRLRCVTDATDPSATVGTRIAPGAYYETPTGRNAGGAWRLWGATTGQAFSWEEW